MMNGVIMRRPSTPMFFSIRSPSQSMNISTTFCTPEGISLRWLVAAATIMMTIAIVSQDIYSVCI